MDKLLVVDDQIAIRKQLKWGLGKHYQVLLAACAESAVQIFEKHRPDVVTLDLGLPPDSEGASEGLRCLEAMLQIQPATKIIVLSGNEEHGHALRAVELGAYDFYAKPINLDELKIILARAFHVAALEEENRQLQQKLAAGGCPQDGIFGQCDKMQELFATLKKVATVDVPVLILGESGTGKELVARALHQRSLRRGGPFIAINCGAIPENLLESELFGYEKGAFTGAHHRLAGKLEYAQGGTLFLDEIGELPLLLQVKILRFLQEKVIQRLGGRDDIAVDVRVVAATNIDMEKAIAAGRFREDLYYRLGVVSVKLCPLRERGGDVVLLSNLFLQRSATEFGKPVRGFSRAALTALAAYEWPGNVRELENKIKRAVVMAEGAIIEPWDLGLATVAGGGESAHERSLANAVMAGSAAAEPANRTLKQARQLLEVEMLTAVLEQCQGNVVNMAKALGVTRPTLYDLLKKYGLHSSTRNQ